MTRKPALRLTLAAATAAAVLLVAHLAGRDISTGRVLAYVAVYAAVWLIVELALRRNNH